MSDITREAPISLSALRPASPRIHFPNDAFSPPTIVGGPAPPLPPLAPPPDIHRMSGPEFIAAEEAAKLNVFPPPPWGQREGDQSPADLWADGPPNRTSGFVPGARLRRPSSDMSLLVSLEPGEGRALIGHEEDWFDIHPEIAAEITRLTLLAYGEHQQRKLLNIAQSLGLWPADSEGQAMQAPNYAAGVVPEVFGENGGEAAPAEDEVRGSGPVPALRLVDDPWTAPMPDVPSVQPGAEVAAPSPRPQGPRGNDGVTLSPFRSLRGDWFKPAHAGEVGGEAVSGPRGLVEGLHAGEHATDGGVPKRGEGERRGRPKKGSRKATASSPPAGQE